ncbi:MAG TPA: DUF1553 domain-containing protein [Candidatus Limnocylindria bacterium]|jgi:hypothetical protein|nr:DUF1553 domain-containing protein [Candidatus Limnocylindria bacterium]
MPYRFSTLALLLSLLVVTPWLRLVAVPASPGGEAFFAPTGHWSFQAIREVAPPTLGRVGQSGNPIDAFIETSLAAHDLHLAPPADRRTLIRRATFDLTGLPPTPEEVAAFIADTRPDAYRRLVDRLMASPRYGERWGRWWLDVARYADTNGQDENKVMANAWRYRDWVIKAFADDLPFDQFTTQQIAGDLLPTNGVPDEVIFNRWIATGLLVMGPKMLAEQDKPKLVMDMVDEQIDVVTRAFLGLTVGCARCHDHKFDPISTRDYYALAGIFKSTRAMANLDFVSKFNERCISSPQELAALEAHEKSLVANTNALAAAIQNANTALTASWKRDFASYLAAAAGAEVPAPATDQGTTPARPAPDKGLVERLGKLLMVDATTNTLSGTLNILAVSPDRAATFVHDFEDSRRGTNGVHLAPGIVGGAFLASGNNYLEIAHRPDLDPPQLTMETWMLTDEFPNDGDTRRWLLNKNGSEWTEGHFGLVIHRDRAGVYLNIGGGKDNVFSVFSEGYNLKAGRWHHIAATYDGAMLRLYCDGRPAGEATVNRPRKPGAQSLALGRRQDGYIYFKGRLDEARVLDRALAPAEIAAHATQPGRPVEAGVVARWEFNDLTTEDRKAMAEVEAYDALFGAAGVFALPKEPRPYYPPTTREAIEQLEHEHDTLMAHAPAPASFALSVTDDQPADLPVHIRGSHLNLAKDPVPRGFIRAAYRGEPPLLSAKQSGRLELARWLTSPDNPLMARVIVNRLWQAHFGEGLVRTPDNFGVRGDLPSHPELLDWLAREFMRTGWSVKAMHRLIMASATYRQQTRETSPADPENRYLSHFPRQRLEAEMVRDALLEVSGRLDEKVGGTLVSWKNDEYAPEDKVSASSTRRTIYLPIVRDRVYDALTIFDFANPSVGMSRRVPTVVSHQALFFLNSPLVKDSATALARTLLARDTDDRDRIRQAYERVLCRPPENDESARAYQFLASVESTFPPTEARTAAWSALCQTLFAANEFLYRD